MKRILRLYKWEFENELFASTYFVAMVSIYGGEVLLRGEQSIDILIMFEMLVVCYVISLVQKFIFWDNNQKGGILLKIRSISWFAVSMAGIILSSVLFGWFNNLQSWAMGAFFGGMMLVLCFIWIGLRILNKVDTEELNQMLNQYQEK